MSYDRGAVVKGPDLFADHDHRPYVRLSDETHPFSGEEALYAAATTTARAAAISIGNEDFVSGGLPRDTYVNPWTVVSIRHADVTDIEGQLDEDAVERIAQTAASYLGVG